jgi:exosortase
MNKMIIQTGILGILFTLLYFPIFPLLIYDWNHDPNYSHGFLIPLVSGYLIWQHRKTLALQKINPSNWGLLWVLFGLVMYVTANIAAELYTMRVSILVVLSGIVISLFGLPTFKIVLFPIAYLLFMIPVPYIIYNLIAFPLKMFVTLQAEVLLHLISIPVLREGNVLHMATGPLEVVDACSGMRSLISLLALGAILGYFTLTSNLHRGILFVSAIPIAVLTNILRVTFTGVLAHYYGQKVAEGFLHEFSGLAVFITALICLVGIGGSLKWIKLQKTFS